MTTTSAALRLRIEERLHRRRFLRFREEAKEIYSSWVAHSPRESDGLLHPLWEVARPELRSLIEGGIPEDFLQHPLVIGRFNRKGFSSPQEHELAYLKRLSSRWALVSAYRESPIGRPSLDCRELPISVNSLGMLYYFARIFEVLDKSKIRAVGEFGGGFGSLCRVFLELLPTRCTYVCIDLPEMLALQYVYLRASSNNYRVVPHAAPPRAIEPGSVHFVPLHLAEDCTFPCDLFISTFGLSETPPAVHELVARRRFFRADAAYLVGQHVRDELWRDHDFAPMDELRSLATQAFPHIRYEDFHFGGAWELLAWRHRLELGKLPPVA